MPAAAYQNEYYGERQCFKSIKILVAIKGKKINIKSKLNYAGLLLAAAQFLLCKVVKGSCSCWLLFYIGQGTANNF